MDNTELARQLCAMFKTHDLIEVLAKENEDWTSDDITRAVCETDALPFSLDDVLYIRATLRDPEYQLQKQLRDDLLARMAELDKDRRVTYYHDHIESHQNAMNHRREEIRQTFTGLVYYTRPCI